MTLLIGDQVHPVHHGRIAEEISLQVSKSSADIVLLFALTGVRAGLAPSDERCPSWTCP